MHNTYENVSQDRIEKYENVVRGAIKDVVAEQRKRGVFPITSGEFERSSFVSGFFEKLEGIEIRNVEFTDFRTKFAVQKPYHAMNRTGRDEPVAISKVKWKQVCITWLLG
jgi:methionine synthase II (cobalamin-independent)